MLGSMLKRGCTIMVYIGSLMSSLKTAFSLGGYNLPLSRTAHQWAFFMDSPHEIF